MVIEGILIWLCVTSAVTIILVKLDAPRRGKVPVAAIMASVLFQLIVRLQLGYFDPFWPIAFVVSFVAGCVLALGLVLVLRILRSRR